MSVKDLFSGRYRGSLAIWALLIAYASLYPFSPLRLPGADAFAFFLRPRYHSGFDFAVNALAYVPLGALACLVFRANGGIALAIGKAAAFGLGVSLAMEGLQLFVPFRVASIADIAANTLGALAGALLFADPMYSLATQPLGAARERAIIAGAWGDFGLVLIALWLIAQFNPALPFFEAGDISGSASDAPAGAPDSLAILQAIAVALSVCGFGLFISVLLQGPAGALRFTLLLLTVALWLKFATAAVMLKPHLSADWANPARAIGLAAGIVLFMPMRRFARPARIYLATVLVLAGALFSKILGAYSPLVDFLFLFNWPHGQLATFATLTRYLHEIWPVAALLYLIAMFIWNRGEAVKMRE